MQSSTGSTYSIWKLTDLDQTTLSIFLFSGAHDELWKQAPGTLIAIFTPKVKNDRELCLTAISGDQVWVLGTAAEFGYCRAQKKSEYNRVKPLGRNEFQGSTLSTAFRAGQQKGLHWQPGRFEPRIAAKPRMHAASPAALSSLAGAAASRGSTAGSKYLVSIADPASVAAAAASRSAAGGALHKALPQGRSVGTLVSQVQRGTKRKGGAVPAGGRGSASPAGPDEVQLAASDDEGEGDGHGPHDPGRRASGDDGARGRALALLMSTRAGQRGFTAPPRPAVPEFLAAPLRAAKSGGPQPDSGTPAAGAVELAAVAAGPQKPSATNTRRQRASSLGKENRAEPSKLASAFGEAVLAQEGDGLAAPGSRYAELVDDEDAARLDGVLQVLERKDELAARMDATTKLQVQAFSCRHCKYVAEKRRPECGGHPHLVDRVTATKRWWGCEACHHRFATMGVKYPTTRCAKCNHPENGFKALSQWRPGKESRTDQQSSVADRSQLLTRGVEQKWVGG
ncbi:MCM10-like protein [Auxenochlorella protothecoides]|uniref:MCM10-like protein n=1 Tax=Auxenochlorella protothecoides TaxID=3075 RepID=A0A087SH08_AUXPR|nr:MCM10-like protein [Auxenochlorella protothecoides]KFM25012.1 MCM10-like protein [Auxenochlorella protothecoides]